MRPFLERIFYGCDNWPKCEWVSWYRPVPEPCPQCGGLQVEVGRDRDKLRCLKHEGEPARFGARNGEKNGHANGKTNGKAAAASKRVVRGSAKAPAKSSRRGA